MKKIDLIIVPFHDYKKWINEGFRTRDAHLFEHFKNDKRINKILVVNRPVSLAEQILKRINWKTNIGEKIYEDDGVCIKEIEKNVYIVDTFVNDLFRVALEGKAWWNSAFRNEKVLNNIQNATEFIGMKDKYLLLQNPMSVGVIGNLNEKKVIFDAIDNWLCHPQMIKNKDMIKSNYEYIDKNADVICTVSDDLKRIFVDNKNINWVSNGVDKEFFAKGISNYGYEKDITIGYVGKIQERVDFKLIEECLSVFNMCKFKFVGPILSEKDKIDKIKEKYKNIEFIGDIHYENLPEEMKKIDIAIIPHKVNEFTNSMNPLKLYEYLASGKQVVTTNVAGCEDISKYVYISEDNEEFICNLGNAIDLYKSDIELGEKVYSTLKDEYTWEYKSDRILSLL